MLNCCGNKGILPDEMVSKELSELFKVLGDQTRVKLLSALGHSEHCVCALAALLEMTPSAVSHQLRVLRQARLVKYRKEGKTVYYSPDDEHIAHIFKQGLEHVLEHFPERSVQ